MMELREQIARAICGNWVVGDDRPWQQWTEEADAVIEMMAWQEPVGYANGDDLDNMLDDRLVVLFPHQDGFRRVPLYLAPGAQAAMPEDIYRDAMRYRALRNIPAEYPAVFAHPGADDYGWDSADGADLDEIVDELIAAAPKPEER